MEKMDRRSLENDLNDWHEENRKMLSNLERTIELIRKLREEEKLQSLAQRAEELKALQDALNRDFASPPESRDERSDSPPQESKDLAGQQDRAAEETEQLAKDVQESADSAEQAPQKLKGIKTKPAPVSGTPVLVDGLGWVECRVVATLPSGDHTLVLGQVIAAGIEHEGEPLTLQEAGFKYSG